MNWKDIKENKWLIVFFMSTAGCIAVIIYLLLKHFEVVTSALGTLIGFFREVIIGGILAYLVNPIAISIKKRLFKNTKMKDGGWALSVAAALIMKEVIGDENRIEEVRKDDLRLSQSLGQITKTTGFPILKNHTSRYYSFGEELFADIVKDVYGILECLLQRQDP